MARSDIFEMIAEQRATGQPFAVVTVIRTADATSAKAGLDRLTVYLESRKCRRAKLSIATRSVIDLLEGRHSSGGTAIRFEMDALMRAFDQDTATELLRKITLITKDL